MNEQCFRLGRNRSDSLRKISGHVQSGGTNGASAEIAADRRSQLDLVRSAHDGARPGLAVELLGRSLWVSLSSVRPGITAPAPVSRSLRATNTTTLARSLAKSMWEFGEVVGPLAGGGCVSTEHWPFVVGKFFDVVRTTPVTVGAGR